jgi:hypothetical protein
VRPVVEGGTFHHLQDIAFDARQVTAMISSPGVIMERRCVRRKED